MKKKIGKVILANMNKSRIIAIDELRRHPLYHKTYQVTSKIMAHDEKNEFNVGSVVEIEETRPISRNKAWKINKVIK